MKKAVFRQVFQTEETAFKNEHTTDRALWSDNLFRILKDKTIQQMLGISLLLVFFGYAIKCIEDYYEEPWIVTSIKSAESGGYIVSSVYIERKEHYSEKSKRKSKTQIAAGK